MMKQIQRLKNKFFGLDPQKSQLESIFSEFCSTSKGASCVLSGRHGSGKSALLDSLLPLFFSDEQIVYENGDLYANFNQPLKKLSSMGLVDEDSTNDVVANHKHRKLVIVVDHFEYFTSKKSQSFLYTLLNGVHRFPWLVILIGSSQDCVLVPPLEKRVYSRLSKSTIRFNARFTENEMFDAFYQLLDCFLGHNDLEEIVEASRDEYESTLKVFFRHCSGIGDLKKLLALMAVVRPMRKLTSDESVVKTMQFCANCICPSQDAAEILNELSLRQLCLLNCFAIRQRLTRKFEILCREVIVEYKRFLNVYQVKSKMGVSENDENDVALYKDLEELIALGAVTFRGLNDIGELQFRSVSLNVEEESLMACFKNRNLPVGVEQWLQFR